MKGQQTASATDILRHDHKMIEKLFDKYYKTESSSDKENIMQTIALQFHMHSELEKEFFFPALSKVLKNNKLELKDKEQHNQINLLLDKLGRIYADDDKKEYESTVSKLNKCFKTLTKEEDELLSKAEKTNMDLGKLGRKIKERQEELKTKPLKLDKEEEYELVMDEPHNRMQPEPKSKN